VKEKDEHRTSNIERPTSNEKQKKMKQWQPSTQSYAEPWKVRRLEDRTPGDDPQITCLRAVTCLPRQRRR